jgi:hypothetical protein
MALLDWLVGRPRSLAVVMSAILASYMLNSTKFFEAILILAGDASYY